VAIKNKPIKINKQLCTNCFKSNHIVFNFAYITYEKDFGDIEKIQFLKRIRDLSSEDFMVVSKWNKSIGFEIERVDIKKQVSSRFENEIEKFDKRFAIIRLYTNNNPYPGRIIGALHNKIFYIFFIDVKGVLYDH
jgi:hypothetical protein